MSDGKIPAFDYALENIKNYIEKFELKAGDRLPSERDMCLEWGVSRTALRSAIQFLVEAHTLESRGGSGTYVAPVRPVSYTGRAGLVGFSDNVRAVGKSPASVLLHAEILPASPHVAKKLRINSGDLVFYLHRLRLVDGLPCMVEKTQVNYAMCPGIENYDFASESLFDVLKTNYGIYVAHGEDRISITRADTQEAELLDIAVDEPVFFETGTAWMDDERRFEYYKSVIRPDRYSFVSEAEDSRYVMAKTSRTVRND